MRLVTDGSCWPNPGPGGWAYIIEWDDEAYDAGWGRERKSTNNRMELTAVINGLQAVSDTGNTQVEVISDSAYVVNCFLQNWRKGWEKRSYHNVKNEDLWKELFGWVDSLTVKWTHVRGHQGHVFNELADVLAEEARMGLR